MKKYYVITKDGKKGPYPADRIASAVKRGEMPGAAKLEETLSGNALTAQQAHDSYEHRQTGRITDAAHAPKVPEPEKAPEPQPTQPTPEPKTSPFENKAFPTVNSNLVSNSPSPAAPVAPSYPQQQQYPQQAGPTGYKQAYPQQQPYPQAAPTPYGHVQQPYYATPTTSGLAIASLILSLTSLVMCPIPLWIDGVICGFKALADTQPNGPKQGRGMALVGIWTGFIIGGITILGIFAIIVSA